MLSLARVDTDPEITDGDDITSAPLAEKFYSWLTKVAREQHFGKDELGNTSSAVAGAPLGARATHAHHIVVKKGILPVRKWLADSQKVLQEVGIDPIFGYENLVWAPNWNGHGCTTRSSTPLNSPGKSYAESVYDRIHNTADAGIYTKDRVVQALQDIAKDFIAGSW